MPFLRAIPLLSVTTGAVVMSVAFAQGVPQLHFPPSRAGLPECRMPVAVPDLRMSERMPGSHAPGSESIGPERFGCTNPLGPSPAPSLTRRRH